MAALRLSGLKIEREEDYLNLHSWARRGGWRKAVGIGGKLSDRYRAAMLCLTSDDDDDPDGFRARAHSRLVRRSEAEVRRRERSFVRRMIGY